MHRFCWTQTPTVHGKLRAFSSVLLFNLTASCHLFISICLCNMHARPLSSITIVDRHKNSVVFLQCFASIISTLRRFHLYIVEGPLPHHADVMRWRSLANWQRRGTANSWTGRVQNRNGAAQNSVNFDSAQPVRRPWNHHNQLACRNHTKKWMENQTGCDWIVLTAAMLLHVRYDSLKRTWITKSCAFFGRSPNPFYSFQLILFDVTVLCRK